MDPHRFFGHRSSAYYFPSLNRADPYFPPPRELDERVYRVRHEPQVSHYYLPPVPNREFIDLPRRRIPPPYVEPTGERIYRTVHRSPPPPLPSPPPVHHHHRSSRKKSKKKKRSRSKGTKNSEYSDDSSYDYDSKSRDNEIFNKFKNLSDEHDSFSDADFGSPIPEHESKETDRVHEESQDQTSSVSEFREDVKQICSNSQDANKHYDSYKLLHDPYLKPGGTGKLLYRFDGIAPNNMSLGTVQVRDPRSPLTKIWNRREPLDLPVPQFKVDINFVYECIIL